MHHLLVNIPKVLAFSPCIPSFLPSARKIPHVSYTFTLTCLPFLLCGGFVVSLFPCRYYMHLRLRSDKTYTILTTPNRISEIIREKKYQARAFLLLPMCFNIGVIIGPILGGVLSDPAGSYPNLFGNVPFFIKYPYATPNIVSSIFLLCAAAAVWLGLQETHDSLRDGPPDLGTRVGHGLMTWCRRVAAKTLAFRRDSSEGYMPVPTNELELAPDGTDGEPGHGQHHASKPPVKRYTQRLPFRRVFTRNVALTLFAQFFLTFHVGTFNSLWFVFLSTPVWDPNTSRYKIDLPFKFTGGIGMHPQSVGMAMAILGVIGITMQLVLYPRVSARLGTIKSWRLFLLFFPLTYFLVPYLSVVPSTSEPPQGKTGILIWLSICAVLFIQVMGRTFALPCQVILVNNCSPHPSVLGTVHGLGQSVSSAARTIGPVVGGVVYGFGLSRGYVGLVFWALSCVAVCACLASLLVREGDGHEIWLDGDEEEEPAEPGR